jgi:O-antigen/teichoic acid export membrane protein
MEKSIPDKIIRNTFFNAIGRFWGILVAVFLTPYIVGRIGIERYGVWAIVGVFTSYFGLLDFGIRASFVKYIAEFFAKNDHNKINQVVSTGFFFYSFFAVLITALAFFLIPPLAGLLGIPRHLYAESVFVLMAGIALFGVSNAFSPVIAVQGGLQRMDISNNLAIAVSIPNIIGTVVFLEKGFGLYGLMLNNAITLALSVAASVFIARRLLPDLRISAGFVDRGMMGKLFNYGYKMQISNLANVVSFQTDKLLITYFLGVGLVTFYQLATAMLQAVRQVCLLLVSSLTPAASEIEATGGKEALRRLYLRGSKYLIAASTPLTIFVLVSADALLRVWMGPGYEKAVPVVRILSVGYYAATITGVASAIAAGAARTDLDMKFGLFLAVTNLVAGITLVVKIGFLGVALAGSLSLIAGSVFYMKIFHDFLGGPMRSFAALVIKSAAAGVLPGAALFCMNHLFGSAWIHPGRFYGLIFIISQGLAFMMIYLMSLRFSGYFDGYDRELLRLRAPRLSILLQ